MSPQETLAELITFIKDEYQTSENTPIITLNFHIRVIQSSMKYMQDGGIDVMKEVSNAFPSKKISIHMEDTRIADFVITIQ